MMGTDEHDALDIVKNLLSYLPSNNMDPAPVFDAPADLAVTDEDLELDTIIPDSPTSPTTSRRSSSMCSTTGSSWKSNRCGRPTW